MFLELLAVDELDPADGIHDDVRTLRLLADRVGTFGEQVVHPVVFEIIHSD